MSIDRSARNRSRRSGERGGSRPARRAMGGRDQRRGARHRQGHAHARPGGVGQSARDRQHLAQRVADPGGDEVDLVRLAPCRRQDQRVRYVLDVDQGLVHVQSPANHGEEAPAAQLEHLQQQTAALTLACDQAGPHDDHLEARTRTQLEQPFLGQPLGDLVWAGWVAWRGLVDHGCLGRPNHRGAGDEHEPAHTGRGGKHGQCEGRVDIHQTVRLRARAWCRAALAAAPRRAPQRPHRRRCRRGLPPCEDRPRPARCGSGQGPAGRRRCRRASAGAGRPSSPRPACGRGGARGSRWRR